MEKEKAAEKEKADPALAAADLTASELAAQGKKAYDKGDFKEAAGLLGQLAAEYGNNAETAALLRECQPLLAFCFVKTGDFAHAVEAIEEALKNPQLPAAVKDDMLFFRGISLLNTGAIQAGQVQMGEYHADEKHDRSRRYEALLLFGTGYVQLNDFESAADFFGWQVPKLPADQQEIAGRATVLWLHSLLEGDRRTDAVKLVESTYPGISGLTQIIGFQLLTLKLGAACLEDGANYDALKCLQRLWPRERLLIHQQARIEAWKARVKKEPQAAGLLSRLEKELKDFTAIPSYDAARQMRMGQAFMGLQRWREAAMILSSAAVTLPPDAKVEQAARTAIESWEMAGASHQVLAATEAWLARFKGAADPEVLPNVLFSRAEAFRSLGRMEEAEKLFGDIANDHADHPVAPRAMLVGGICQLETDRSNAALDTFAALRIRFKKGPLHEDATFWQGMGLSFDHRYDEARERLAEYLETYPQGRYPGDAAFERARCLHNSLRHDAAAEEFAGFLKEYPDNRHAAEARLLQAESHMATGRMDKGMGLLRTIPEEEPRLREEAEFRIGEALRKLGRHDEMRAHFERFLKDRPQSRRLAEATAQMARARQQLDDSEGARAVLWETLLRFGPDPKNEGVEDLLVSLPRFHRGKDAQMALLLALDTAAGEARKAKTMTLALRLDWARGHILRDTSPRESRSIFYELAPMIDPAMHDPRIIADCADALRANGNPVKAREVYLALRKWHPRCVEKERASLGLAILDIASGDDASAHRWLDRCIQETVTGISGNDALLAKAGLLRKEKNPARAAELFEKVTRSRLASIRQKASALLGLGHCARETGDLAKAAMHFQRCALSFARHKDLAAEAWLQHGLTLEARKEPAAAVAVYTEMLSQAGVSAEAPAAAARDRLASLRSSGTP